MPRRDSAMPPPGSRASTPLPVPEDELPDSVVSVFICDQDWRGTYHKMLFRGLLHWTGRRAATTCEKFLFGVLCLVSMIPAELVTPNWSVHIIDFFLIRASTFKIFRNWRFPLMLHMNIALWNNNPLLGSCYIHNIWFKHDTKTPLVENQG